MRIKRVIMKKCSCTRELPVCTSTIHSIKFYQKNLHKHCPRVSKSLDRIEGWGVKALSLPAISCKTNLPGPRINVELPEVYFLYFFYPDTDPNFEKKTRFRILSSWKKQALEKKKPDTDPISEKTPNPDPDPI